MTKNINREISVLNRPFGGFLTRKPREASASDFDETEICLLFFFQKIDFFFFFFFQMKGMNA